jgi:hypothetical protein
LLAEIELIEASSAERSEAVRRCSNGARTTSIVSQAIGVGRPLGEIIDNGVRRAGGVDLGRESGRKAN